MAVEENNNNVYIITNIIISLKRVNNIRLIIRTNKQLITKVRIIGLNHVDNVNRKSVTLT